MNSIADSRATLDHRQIQYSNRTIDGLSVPLRRERATIIKHFHKNCVSVGWPDERRSSLPCFFCFAHENLKVNNNTMRVFGLPNNIFVFFLFFFSAISVTCLAHPLRLSFLIDPNDATYRFSIDHLLNPQSIADTHFRWHNKTL